MEPGALLEVAVDRLLAEPVERLAGDVGGHVGIAVAVSPHPRPEGEEGRHVVELPRIPFGEAAAERFVDPGHCLPEPRHERQPALDLVEDTRPRRPQKGGLPEDRQLAADIGLDPGAFAGEEIGPVELLEGVAHPPQLRADRAPLRLAGVGGEDELHREPLERGGDVGGAEAERLQLADRRGRGFGRRFRVAITFPFPQDPDALPVLGDVGEIEIDRERFGHEPGLDDVEPLDALGERRLGPLLPGPAVVGKRPDPLHEPGDILPRLIDDHLSEKGVEEPHVAEEEIIVRHGVFPEMGKGGRQGANRPGGGRDRGGRRQRRPERGRTPNGCPCKPRAGGGGDVLGTQRGTILAENLPRR